MAFYNDQHYINQVIEGNINAFTVLVNHHKDLVFTLAYKMLKNKEEAEEVAQDVFVKVFNSIRQFKGESKFSTWLYKITYNSCLDRLKKERKVDKFVYIEELNEHQIKALENMLENIEEADRNQKIQECLQFLPSEEAFLLTLYYFDNQSINQIAEVIESNANNVKIKLHRSRKKLASIMKEQLAPEITSYYERE